MSAPPTDCPVSRLTVVTRSATAATALSPSLAAGMLQHVEHEGDVEVGQDAGSGTGGRRRAPGTARGRRSCGRRPRGRSCRRRSASIPSSARPATMPAAYRAEQLPGVRVGRCPGGDGHAELAGAHHDGPAAGGPAGAVGARAPAGVEVDLGVEVLVAADEGAVAPVGVEPQRRRPGRVAVAGVAGQHAPRRGRGRRRPRRRRGSAAATPCHAVAHPVRVTSGEVDQASPSSPAQVSEQQYS